MEEEQTTDVKITLTITCPDNATADKVTDALSKAMNRFDEVTYKTRME